MTLSSIGISIPLAWWGRGESRRERERGRRGKRVRRENKDGETVRGVY